MDLGEGRGKIDFCLWNFYSLLVDSGFVVASQFFPDFCCCCCLQLLHCPHLNYSVCERGYHLLEEALADHQNISDFVVVVVDSSEMKVEGD